MNKKILSIIIMNFAFLPSALAARIPQANNVRIVEDTLWVATFFVMTLFALSMMKFTKGGVKGLYYGYITLLVAAICGFLWKGIGLVKRVAIFSNPDWVFNLGRETFEGAAGLIFGIAFIVLLLAIRKMK